MAKKIRNEENTNVVADESATRLPVRELDNPEGILDLVKAAPEGKVDYVQTEADVGKE